MEMKKISLEENNEQSTAKIDLTKTKGKKIDPAKLRLTIVVIIGLVVGVFTARYRIGQTSIESGVNTDLLAAPTSAEEVQIDQTFGSADEDTFRDSAEGVLQAEGIDGEGSHHIVRPGGISQIVYITSSVVDLDLFVGHNIMVWGETFASKKAGWFMDVGRVKVLELNAELPE